MIHKIGWYATWDQMTIQKKMELEKYLSDLVSDLKRSLVYLRKC